MIVHRSKAEDHFARWLNSRRVRYEYETRTFILVNGEHYTPDFWLPDVGTFVEVKAGDVSRLHKPWLLSRQLSSELQIFVWSYGHTWRPTAEGWTSENLWYRCLDCHVTYPASMDNHTNCRACRHRGLSSWPTPFTGKKEYRKKDPIRSWRPSDDLKKLVGLK